MKILIVCALLVASSLGEPPVDNRYLPPQQSYSGGPSQPSQSYGPPNTGFGPQRQTDAVFRGRLSSNYGAPSPNIRSNSRPSTQYGPPSQLSSQYRPPSQVSSQYIPPRSQPSSSYGTPRQFESQSGLSRQIDAQNGFSRNGPSRPRAQVPETEYGVPSIGQQSSQRFGSIGGGQQYSQGRNAPSNMYGAPAQSRQYLPPGSGGYSGDQDTDSEPANYSFEYMVKDDVSGNDFGHREARQGDRAEGLYYVLLPDGRKQTVQYEADQDGYKPRISYEDTGSGAGGYDRNSQALNNYQSGYQNQNGGPY